VKVGFMVSEYGLALETLIAAKEALQGTNTKLIGSLFADNLLYDGGIDPDLMVKLARESDCDGFLIDTLVKDGRNLFDFIPEERLKEIVLEGKELGMSTALSGHLKMSDIDELSRVNPDIVGVRGAVCQKGDRDSRVHWESVAEFKHQLDQRASGEVDVYSDTKQSAIKNDSNGWVVIDGTGKTCAGIIAALSNQIKLDESSFVEVIIPDVLNTYDLIVWSENNKHEIVTQRKDSQGTIRMLIKP
jgi:TusA-related sulfurtransferase